MNAPRKDRLGRGLGALIGDYLQPEAPAPAGDVRTVPIAALSPNPLQPRKTFSDKDLEDLVASIGQNGLLQPLVVRPAGPGRYELVAGERRLRSVQRLGWTDVPVVVREVDDEALLVLALVENLQRAGLNPIEEAEGYRQLAEQFGLTQDDIARAVGKDRTTVTNLLRLLRLPPSIRKLVESGELSMGHARALLAVEDPLRAADLARQAVKEGWSVREVERRARAAAPARGKPRAADGPRDAVVRTLEDALCERLATRVRLRAGRKGAGVIEVPFDGTEEFERLFALITGREVSDLVN